MRPVTRTEALAAAVKLVDELAPRSSSGGRYADGSVKAGERVELVLRVADWLLAGGEASEALPLMVAEPCPMRAYDGCINHD